jgi:RNA polymerase sigma-70 factor (ECF subfamily)
MGLATICKGLSYSILTQQDSGDFVNVPESDWLRLAIHGDENAFAQLVEAYQTPVYNLCYRMLGDEASAEDAAQETFWRAFRNLQRYDPKRPFITWLLSIAAHYCIDQQRKRRLPVLELDEFPDFDVADPAIPSPEKAFFQQEEEAALHRLLDRLNPQDRAAVILRYWYDCSEEEISQMLSLSVSAVKSRLHRSRVQLAKMVVNSGLEGSQRRSQDESPTV